MRERKIAKRLGANKLLAILREELLSHGISVGNQKFLDILRAKIHHYISFQLPYLNRTIG
ncbi:MAG: hypothetical protein ACI9XB_003672 [Gammaproteobacteria bacterium]